MLSTFSCTCWSFVYLLWILFVQCLWPFLIGFFLSFCFAIELNETLTILDINPLSDIWFANIFSHFMGCLFIFWFLLLLWRNCSFAAVQLVYFCFCCLCFLWHIQKIIAKTNVKELLSCVFMKEFYSFGSCVSLYSISSQFLWMVQDRDPISFFCMWIYSFPSIISWSLSFPYGVFLAPVLSWSCLSIIMLLTRNAWEYWPGPILYVAIPHRYFPIWSQCCGWTGPYGSYNYWETHFSSKHQGTLKSQGLLLTGPGEYPEHQGPQSKVMKRERERAKTWGSVFTGLESGVLRLSWVYSFFLPVLLWYNWHTIQQCIILMYTAWCFDLHTSWNDYHNTFNEHPSSLIDTKLKK